jgi:hypothetical protein
VIYASDVAFPFLPSSRRDHFMENTYIITAASAIAVAAIYFLCVRKLGAQDRQPEASRKSVDIQP